MDRMLSSNMKQLFQRLEAQAGSRILLKYMSGSEVVSMGAPAFFAMSRRYAAQLQQRGLSGAHIGLMGANSPEWLANLCAVYLVGGIAVPLSPDLTPERLAEQAAQADLNMILCDASLEQIALAASLPYLSMQDRLDGEISYTDDGADPEPTSLACILFTSGTTARNKAVMFSHQALIAGICHNVIHFPFASQLAILPLHHIFGFASVLNTWYLGRIVCLGREIQHLYSYLTQMQPDYLATVPSILLAILQKMKKADAHGQDLGWKLQLVSCGSAQFPSAALRELQDRNIRVLNSYGATEAGGIGISWEMTPRSLGSLGKPSNCLNVKIVDGELFLKSAALMDGYYKDPKGTAEVLIDGWYATGDLCEQDAEGYLYLKGRKKNLIILSNGENVSPEQIENAFDSNPYIHEIMVGLRHNLITAFIYPQEGAPEQCIRSDIARYNATVPRSHQIQDIEILDAPFKKTDIGKKIRMTILGGV